MLWYLLGTKGTIPSITETNKYKSQELVVTTLRFASLRFAPLRFAPLRYATIPPRTPPPIHSTPPRSPYCVNLHTAKKNRNPSTRSRDFVDIVRFRSASLLSASLRSAPLRYNPSPNSPPPIHSTPPRSPYCVNLHTAKKNSKSIHPFSRFRRYCSVSLLWRLIKGGHQDTGIQTRPSYSVYLHTAEKNFEIHPPVLEICGMAL